MNIPLIAAIIARWPREPSCPLLRGSRATGLRCRSRSWRRSASCSRCSGSALRSSRSRSSGPLVADRALPALGVQRARRDAARAHRPADRARQPPPLPRAAAARPRRRRRSGAVALTPLPARHRRLQADQRSLRPPVGDGVLAQVAHAPPPGRRGVPARRRRVRAAPAAAATSTRRSRSRRPIIERVADIELEHGGTAHRRAGVATYPGHGVERCELVRVADSALYLARSTARTACASTARTLLELAELRRLADRTRPGGTAPRCGSARACGRCTRCLHGLALGRGRGARRADGTANGPRTRTDRAAPPGRQLHDLGKLAIPEEILRKPGPLNEAERLVLERHPQIGFRMLDSLGVEPVADLGPAPPRALGRRRLPGQPRRRTRSRSARGSSSSPTPTTR